MSQFDSLLDFGDTGTTNPSKQPTEDPFDPLGEQDSNVNGGGSGDLLDLGFDMQVSSQNGSGKISLEANTNPLYEFSNNSSQDIMDSEPSNPLYEISNDTYNQDLKAPSANPLYDFLENEKDTEIHTNGHTEDLLGTTDSNEVDLLGNSGPITSDDSGVTMDTNNFDGSHVEIMEEQRNGESTEESDTQGKANVGEVLLTEGEVNGTSGTVKKDQTDKGPLDQEDESSIDQGIVEQEVNKIPEPEENLPVQGQEPVVADDIAKGEPETVTETMETNQFEKEETEIAEDKIAVNDATEVDQEAPKAEEEPVKDDIDQSVDQSKLKELDQQTETENEEPKESTHTEETADDVREPDSEIALEPVHDEHLESAVIEGKMELNKQQTQEDTVTAEQAQQEQADLAVVDHHFGGEEDISARSEQVVQEADSQVIPADQAITEVHDDLSVEKDQTAQEEVQEMDKIDSQVSEQAQDEVNQSTEQAVIVDDITEQQLAPEVQEDKTVDQEVVKESEPVIEKSENKQEHTEQEPSELDEETSQTKQSQKQTDSKKDTEDEGALKVNGTSEENDIGANEEETVRDPNIYRETREKEEVHFTELNNVRQRFESGASGDGEPTQRKHSVKEDYDEGGEYESTPTVNPDVVKETDETGEELPEVGTAKNILAKFQQLETEGSVPRPSEKRITPPRQTKVEYESQPKERLQQYEGKSDAGVFESQPSVNEGIIRYGEQLEQEPELEKGHARSIVSKYKEIEEEHAKVVTREKKELTPDRSGKVEYVSEPRGQSIENYEVKIESGVFESTPKVEEDVVRADERPDEIMPEEGMAKNLLSKFKQLETEVADRPPPSPLRSTTPDRTKREFVSGPRRGYLEKYEGQSFEQPVDLVKSDEVPEEIMPEAGSAKKQMERFKELEKQSSSPVHSSRKEFTPPREASPGKTIAGVLESTPIERLEGVVKSTDVYETELPEQGMAKNLASKFKQLESESSSTSTSPGRGRKEFTPPPEAGVYENIPAEPLVVEQRKAESGVLESTPARNPDIAREHDQSPEVELPERGYAKNMVSKFRQLESESAKGSSSGSPQKYKEFTPPRDTRGLLSPKSPSGVSEGVQPSELPGQYQQQVTAGVYENEPEARPDLCREADTDWDEGLPAANTTKSMKQRFQEMENKALKELETPEPIHRKGIAAAKKKEKGMFITVEPDKCSACGKTVYAMEKLEMNKNVYHRGCFKCSHCSATLTAKTFSINEGVIYCTTHFKQLFARKGNYDEGFGRQQYKKKWAEEQARKKDATA